MDALEKIAEAMAAHPGNGIPKYLALYDQMLRRIEAGSWKPGDQLPAETEITRRVSVSLGTVQRALKRLVDDGVLIRRHGHGTFVATPAATESEIRNFRFLADDGKGLLPVYPKVLSIDLTTAAGPWSEFLGRDNSFVRITRIASVNLEFLSSLEMYLRASSFKVFLTYPVSDLDGVALTHLLGQRLNAPALKIEQRIGFSVIPDAAARLINVATGTIGMEWEQRAFTYRNAPLYYQRVYLPPNNRKLVWDADL